MGQRVTCYHDDCIHEMGSHCGNKGGNITVGKKGCFDYKKRASK